ncbi:sulfotransferase domain-containing protein [Salinibacter grassmerensis]|uniref:sulfotransferase domain-containing protein n=1 Tax=Salinibacter grassmerensis TaxID=3040353 RepID=UPI0021E8DCAB|nr:sulfotransferase domain-containing protein [Salinibacter grassmerensis]
MSTSETTEIVTPTFILGGTPKAGTTSVYHYLDQHPQVCMSARKETSVFIDDKSLEWLFENYYRHYDGERAVGEASAGTLGNPAVAERVYGALPDVQLIFVLRDPVDRLYSHFTFLQSSRAIDPDRSFSEFIRSETEWRTTLIDLGRYHRHLSRFEKYFDRDQMLVLLFEDLKTDAEEFMESVYRFIGVEPSFRPSFDVQNQTRRPRFNGVYRLLSKIWASVQERVSVYAVKHTQPLRRAVKRLVTEEAERPPMTEADKRYLQDIYHEPNRKIEGWLGQDLSHWKSV